MTDLDKTITLALQTAPIGNQQEDAVIERLLDLLSSSYLLAGYKIPSNFDLVIIAQKLYNKLLRDCAMLTFEEINICFTLGIEGAYGDYTGLSLTVYSAWLRRYKTSDLRYKAVLERQKATQPALPPVSESYNEAANDKFLRRAYEQYLADYPIDRLMPGRIYRLLQKRKLINNTPTEKREAIARFANWKPETRLPIDETAISYFRNNKAMEMLLQRYFDKLRDEDVRELPLYTEYKPEQPV